MVGEQTKRAFEYVIQDTWICLDKYGKEFKRSVKATVTVGSDGKRNVAWPQGITSADFLRTYIWLRDNGIIDFADLDFKGDEEHKRHERRDFRVRLLDWDKLESARNEIQRRQIARRSQKPARIDYDIKTGFGVTHGKSFRVSGKNKKVIDYLVKHQGEWLEKKMLWKLIDRRAGELDKSSATIDINIFVKNLRKKLYVNKYQLPQNKGSIYLNAEVTEVTRLFPDD